MAKLHEFKQHLRAGQVYRRADLAKWSNAVDRHLRTLVAEGALVKVSAGVYSCPKKTPFGNAPAFDAKLVKAFLKDDDFLVISPNAYNALGLGTTQLHKDTVVYNLKRHGNFELGGRTFKFKRHYRRLPKELTCEFLMVDLVDNLKSLGEDAESVSMRVKEKLPKMYSKALSKAVKLYGGTKAKNFFAQAL